MERPPCCQIGGMDDPYRLLGVARGATDDEIRAAYRRLAKQLHPDLNPGRRGAEDRFKQVSAAYALLSDPQKRARFDRGEIDASGAERAPPHGFGFGRRRAGEAPRKDDDFGADDLDSLFERAFGGSRGRGGRSRGDDMRLEVQVSFEEAACGAVKRLSLPDGRAVDLRIPEGFEDGQSLRLKGQGHPARGAGPAGDALVTVRVQPHRHFQRSGNDVFLPLPVTLQEAVLGARIEVPTLAGPVTLSVPPGSGQGTKLRLKGRGIAGGDQYVELRLVLPERPEPELASFLEDWKPRHPFNPRKGGIER